MVSTGGKLVGTFPSFQMVVANGRSRQNRTTTPA